MTDAVERIAHESTELWVCVPCNVFPPEDRVGAIHVPGGVKGRVWCPWCGDAMDPDAMDSLTDDEKASVRALKPDGE